MLLGSSQLDSKELDDYIDDAVKQYTSVVTIVIDLFDFKDSTAPVDFVTHFGLFCNH